ncbi:MAG: hypothetical protein K2X81_27460 [Candidatus Obscuribacterales bacterium]|nr:hypothetical protein [Candidatus Obscuribacterales bacterium]
MKNFDHSAELKDDLPLPSVNRIDYSNPAQYLDLQKSFGRLEELASLASVLGNESASQTLLSICHYINRNVIQEQS